MKTLTTITNLDLSTVAGGNRVTLLESLIKRLGDADLSSKQIGKLNDKLDGFEAKAAKKGKGVVPGITEGDFGAPPSSYLQLRGD